MQEVWCDCRLRKWYGLSVLLHQQHVTVYVQQEVVRGHCLFLILEKQRHSHCVRVTKDSCSDLMYYFGYIRSGWDIAGVIIVEVLNS